MVKRVVLLAAMLSTAATAAVAQTTVFLVRHAERADSGSGGMSSDPVLSAAGRARALRLVEVLKDTKLTAVFATEFKRTQQTAAPTAKAQKLTVTTVPGGETATLVNKLKAATGAVLVVGHSNTLPEVMAALGVPTPVKIDDAEFDNLFIVITGTPRRFVRLRYK